MVTRHKGHTTVFFTVTVLVTVFHGVDAIDGFTVLKAKLLMGVHHQFDGPQLEVFSSGADGHQTEHTGGIILHRHLLLK
ncbi:hypothetical protein D3C74_395660 [compost metagenome]